MDVAIIGAGPSGLAAARALQRAGIRADGYELSHGVGGLWDITNPQSTMYESAHLISSRTTTQFTEFPMRTRADYPGHSVMKEYFTDYARHFGLTEQFQFNSRVTSLKPADGAWSLEAEPAGPGPTGAGTAGAGSPFSRGYDHVIIANGTLATPNVPTFAGEFTGEMIHSSEYKSASQLTGKRVLVIGAGNSGCDIAVDAVHHADSVDMAVRRGYYFVPRYIFGRPTDTFNQGRPLPRPIKQFLDKWLLRAFTGNPEKFGFPKPDYKIYESHPIVNTMVLNHLGQGDLQIRPDIDRFDGRRVHFGDGTSSEYDLVLLATGYSLDYPFVAGEHLNWNNAAPDLFLNIFPPAFNGLYVMGMVEASGLGWQGRYEQAQLLATYLRTEREVPARAKGFRRRVAEQPWPDLTGGYRYLGLDRMSYYVNKDAYRSAVKGEIRNLLRPAPATTHSTNPAHPTKTGDPS